MANLQVSSFVNSIRPFLSNPDINKADIEIQFSKDHFVMSLLSTNKSSNMKCDLMDEGFDDVVYCKKKSRVYTKYLAGKNLFDLICFLHRKPKKVLNTFGIQLEWEGTFRSNMSYDYSDD